MKYTVLHLECSTSQCGRRRFEVLRGGKKKVYEGLACQLSTRVHGRPLRPGRLGCPRSSRRKLAASMRMKWSSCAQDVQVLWCCAVLLVADQANHLVGKPRLCKRGQKSANEGATGVVHEGHTTSGCGHVVKHITGVSTIRCHDFRQHEQGQLLSSQVPQYGGQAKPGLPFGDALLRTRLSERTQADDEALSGCKLRVERAALPACVGTIELGPTSTRVSAAEGR